MVTELLKDQKEAKILLYCTGGIRCEKASAYLKHHGFKDVNQLHGESVNGQVIAKYHQCVKPYDVHSNCANELCHLLFIQCSECASRFDGCCSKECCDQKNASENEPAIIRKGIGNKFGDGDLVLIF